MTAWFGLLTCALLLGAVAACWPAPPHNRRINAALVAAAALLPLPGGDSAAMWLHALIGTPSAMLAQLAVLACLGCRPVALEKPIVLAFVLLATEFYALALGIGQADVYGIGFRNPLLVVAIFPIGLWFWHTGKTSWLLLLAVALLAYACGGYANLWDALFDPLLVLISLIYLLRRNRSSKENTMKTVRHAQRDETASADDLLKK